MSSGLQRVNFVPYPLLSSQALPVILGKLPAMIPHDLASIAYACGSLGYRDDRLLLPMYKLMMEYSMGTRQQGGSSSSNRQQESVVDNQQLCNVCWAGAVLDMHQFSGPLQQMAAGVCSSDGPELKPEEKRQLYQLHMWLLDLDKRRMRSRAGNGSSMYNLGFSAFLSKQQLQECQELWQSWMALAASGGAEREMLAAVKALPELIANPTLGRLTDDGLVAIDISATTSSGVPLAFRVEGPRTVRQPDLQLIGPSLYRIRALMARGYVVVVITVVEWYKVSSGVTAEPVK